MNADLIYSHVKRQRIFCRLVLNYESKNGMQVEQEFALDTMSGTVILLRNNESFFEYDKVIISVGA